jgi:hypothetical protein
MVALLSVFRIGHAKEVNQRFAGELLFAVLEDGTNLIVVDIHLINDRLTSGLSWAYLPQLILI